MISGRGSSRCCRQIVAVGAIRLVIAVGWLRASCIAIALESRGEIYRVKSSGRGRRCGNGIAATPPTGPGTRCWPTFLPRPTQRARWGGRCLSTPRSAVHTSTQRIRHGPIRTQGARSNYTNLPIEFESSPLGGDREPAGHGIGRSRGGLTTKIHAAVDTHGRPLAMVVTGGQRNDGAMLAEVLDDIRVPRTGAGRPRTRPEAVLADRAIHQWRQPAYPRRSRY